MRLARAIVIVLTSVAVGACWLTESSDALDCKDCGGVDGGTQTTTDAPATTNPCADAYFCESFENGLGVFDPSRESLSSGATIATDTSQHKGGSASAKLSVAPASDPSATLRRTATLGDESYTRLYVFVPSGPAKTGSDAYYLAMAALTPNDDTVSLRIDGDPSSRKLEIGDARNNLYLTSETAFPFDQWTCLEWHIGSQGMQVWQNDVELTDVTTTGALTAPSDQFFGPSIPTGLDEPMTMWIDEIIVSKSKVGCSAFQ